MSGAPSMCRIAHVVALVVVAVLLARPWRVADICRGSFATGGMSRVTLSRPGIRCLREGWTPIPTGASARGGRLSPAHPRENVRLLSRQPPCAARRGPRMPSFDVLTADAGSQVRVGDGSPPIDL